MSNICLSIRELKFEETEAETNCVVVNIKCQTFKVKNSAKLAKEIKDLGWITVESSKNMHIRLTSTQCCAQTSKNVCKTQRQRRL
ncbi:CLUMA_CG007444, isoform A [Clunio marinus]|uniref:CLUMA_CG007444, isoform A n=1 Tax=Clunio marinus TaxID=568069 RepID=A0A1J1I0W5_9DIPT|nr:CLUMA_CG007444, isoform A [Clunio marinus]